MRDPFHLRYVAELIGVSCALAGLRALWLYGRSRLGAALLLLSMAGAALAGAAWMLTAWPRWIVWVGLVVACGPISLWLVVRWLDYQGPPVGLLREPEPLEAAENAVEGAMEVELKRTPFGPGPGADR